jgi:outer membrane protein OmpA-like peptidoglycan-associated protein
VPLRRSLRPAFSFNLLLPAVVAMAALGAGAEGKRVLPLALLVPAGMAMDVATGRAWAHSPRVLDVALTELPPPSLPPNLSPDLPLDPARASVAARLLLADMAAAADQAGCNRIVSETWLDERDRVEPASVSPADSAVIAARAREHVEGARARLRELCARSNPLLDSLVAVQSASAPDDLPAGETGGPSADADGAETGSGAMDAAEACAAAALGHCITFPFGSAEIRPAFQDGLRDIAARLRSFELPVLIVVEGTADPAGSGQPNLRLGLARAMAVRDALVAMGVRPDRVFVESCEEERCRLVPGASGGAPGAELNRRVRFHLQITEGAP